MDSGARVVRGSGGGRLRCNPLSETDLTDSRPSVVHVLHRLYRAGAELLAADLARRLGDAYRFSFVCLDEVGPLGEELLAEGYAVRCLDRQPGVDLGTAWRMARVLDELGADIVHAHQYTPFFYSASARLGMGTPPIVFTEHGRHVPDVRKLKRVMANQVLLKPGDRVTAVGAYVRDALVANEGIEHDRVEVIRNGIDAAAFGQPVRSRGEVRAELGLGEMTPVVIQVARFHPVKDHGTALRALARLRESIPEAVLLLVGDGEGRGELEGLAEEMGLDESVRFLGVREDIADLLGASDVFLLTSVSEGVSLTLLEASAAGLPIVATRVGGNPEVVEHGVTGLLADAADSTALACRLRQLLEDDGLRQTMGAAGAVRIRRWFDQTEMHESYQRVYDQVLCVRGVSQRAA